MQVTDKCDVYSFGVVALEVMLGKHPGDLLVSDSSSLLLKELLDQRLQPPAGQLADEVVSVVSMGMACTRSDPDSRPMMRFVAQELSARTQPRLSEPLGSITISKLSTFQK